jgi:hypothetical protein
MTRRAGAFLACLLLLAVSACTDDKTPTPAPREVSTTLAATAVPTDTSRPPTGAPATVEAVETPAVSEGVATPTTAAVPATAEIPATPATRVTSGGAITPKASPTTLRVAIVSTPGVGTEYAADLEPLGRAYAEDSGLTFREVRTSLSGTVANGGDTARWATQVERALLAGCKRKSGAFDPVAFELISGVLNVKMEGGRTPSQVVQAVLAPGSVVVHATWRFDEGKPVDTYTIFSSNREPLFDTLLSMPWLDISDFLGDHF